MSVANSYARALYEAAQEVNPSEEFFDQIWNQLKEFHALVENSKDIRVALFTPVTTAREKILLVETLSKKFQFSSLVGEFLTLLARKNRLSIFSAICEAFLFERLISEGGVPGRLVVAEPMAEADVQALAKVFSQKLGKKVAFQVVTDPSLLAGLKATVNGVTYDGTLRSQIQKLRDYFVAGLPGVHG